MICTKVKMNVKTYSSKYKKIEEKTNTRYFYLTAGNGKKTETYLRNSSTKNENDVISCQNLSTYSILPHTYFHTMSDRMTCVSYEKSSEKMFFC